MHPTTRHSYPLKVHRDVQRPAFDRPHHGQGTSYPPRTHGPVLHHESTSLAEHRPPVPPQIDAIDRPAFRFRASREKARRRLRNIEQGYSKFRGFYSSLAFGATVLFTLVKLNNVGEVIAQATAECDHADTILEQVDAVLGDAETARNLRADHAGRTLLAKLENVQDSLTQAIDDLRERVEKYDGDRLGLGSKAAFYVHDSQKIAGLRGRLRQHLSEIQDLSVWLNRLASSLRIRIRCCT